MTNADAYELLIKIAGQILDILEDALFDNN